MTLEYDCQLDFEDLDLVYLSHSEVPFINNCRFCDELTDKYSDKLWHEIPTGREEAQPPKSRK